MNDSVGSIYVLLVDLRFGLGVSFSNLEFISYVAISISLARRLCFSAVRHFDILATSNIVVLQCWAANKNVESTQIPQRLF